jgi:hypothetical protein
VRTLSPLSGSTRPHYIPLETDPAENTVPDKSSIVFIGSYVVTAPIFLTCLFLSARTCLPSSYLATAAVHRVTVRHRANTAHYGSQLEVTNLYKKYFFKVFASVKNHGSYSFLLLASVCTDVNTSKVSESIQMFLEVSSSHGYPDL